MDGITAPSENHMRSSSADTATNKQEYMDEAYTALASVYDKYHSDTAVPLAAILKKNCIKEIAPKPGVTFLDMAGGTGDATKYFLEYQDEVNHDTSSTVALVDLNDAMLQVAQKRLGDTKWADDGRIKFMQGNAEHVPEIPDSSFDIYCSFYGIHNMPNRDKVLKEAMRVLKPGGKIYVMEFNTGVWLIGRMVRRLWYQLILYLASRSYGDRSMSLRLNKSGMDFPPPPVFVQEMKDAGFQVEGQGYISMTFDTTALFVGTKPAAQT